MASGCGCGRRGRGCVRVRVSRRGRLVAVGSRRVRAGRASTVVSVDALAAGARRRARVFAAGWRARGRRVSCADERQRGWVARCRASAATGCAPDPRGPLSLRRTLARVAGSYPPMPLDRPDVLVLAGGGTLGEAWMRGLLDGAGTAAGIDFRECEYFVGTSAGSIVAAFLAAGRAPDSGAEARAARDWAAAAERQRNARAALRRALGARSAGRRRGAARAASRSRRRPPAARSLAPPRCGPRRGPTRSMPGLGRLIDAEGRALRRAPARSSRWTAATAAASCSARPTPRRAGRRGGAGVVLGAVDLRAGGDRRARVRRRRRLEPDEPRRHARPPRHPGAVPQPDRLAPGHALRLRRAARVLALAPRWRRRWRCGRAARRCARSRPTPAPPRRWA